MIAFPIQQEGSDQSLAFSSEEGTSSQHSYYEEWGYAERAWYVEGKTGLSGVVRALFWPTEGVVEVGHHDRVWADRTLQPPAEQFEFRLSEEGYHRLRRHLHSTLLMEEPVVIFGHSTFYPAKRSYHLFHTCHQYAAHALLEAGLPLSAFWAFNRTSLAWQLQRATKIAARNSQRRDRSYSPANILPAYPTLDALRVVQSPQSSALGQSRRNDGSQTNSENRLERTHMSPGDLWMRRR